MVAHQRQSTCSMQHPTNALLRSHRDKWSSCFRALLRTESSRLKLKASLIVRPQYIWRATCWSGRLFSCVYFSKINSLRKWSFWLANELSKTAFSCCGQPTVYVPHIYKILSVCMCDQSLNLKQLVFTTDRPQKDAFKVEQKRCNSVYIGLYCDALEQWSYLATCFSRYSDAAVSVNVTFIDSSWIRTHFSVNAGGQSATAE